MKSLNRKIVYILVVVTFLVAYCERGQTTRLGFDISFSENSHGSSIVSVDNHARSLVLEGEIVLVAGELAVELYDPSGELVYSVYLESPGMHSLKESVRAIDGDWRIEYHCTGGSGSLKIHLSILDF